MPETQEQQQIAVLEQHLSQANAAENFFETSAGRLSVELATVEINKLIKDICSDKFLKDHIGYVNAVCQLMARKDWLKRIQIAASPIRKNKVLQKKAELENKDYA